MVWAWAGIDRQNVKAARTTLSVISISLSTASLALISTIADIAKYRLKGLTSHCKRAMPTSDKDHEEYDVATEMKLLALVNDVDQFSRDNLAVSGLNIFEAAGLIRQEIRHSNFLSFLLRPQEAHGLGDHFLRRLLRKAVDETTDDLALRPLDIVLGDFSDALVSREWRNMDIVVESKQNNLVFVIENKVDSSESENQLLGYRELISNEFKNAIKIFAYLTVDNEAPTDERWAAISYSDVIDSLEEALDDVGDVNESAKLVLKHYVALIRRHIVPDQTLVDHCRKIYANHREALELIIRYGEVSAFSSAAARFFEAHQSLKPLTIRPTAAIFLPNDLLSSLPEFPGMSWWGQARPVVFWFNLSGNRFGIVIEVGPLVDTRFDRTTLTQSLLNYFKSKSKIYPKYTRVFSKYTRLTDDQIANPEELLNAMNSLYGATVEHLPTVKKIVTDFFKV